MNSETPINLYNMKKRIGYLIIYWKIVFYQFGNNFLVLLRKINVFGIFRFFISPDTEIVIKSNS